MTKLEEPLEVAYGINDSIWVTYEFKMNDNETIYYAPKRVEYNEQIFINETEGYIRVKVNGIFRSVTYPTANTLKEIFKE